VTATNPKGTMQRIAEALNVSQRTVSEELRNLEATSKSKQPKTASNPKGASRPKGTKKRIAEYLYGKREWTMQRLAEALNVSKMQISREFDDCNATLQSKPTKTATNPKGAGRPKGSTNLIVAPRNI
jgi:transcriptional antiterminator